MRCEAYTKDRDIHVFPLGTPSDENPDLDVRSYVSGTSSRHRERREAERRVAELSERLVEQANATAAQANAAAAAERGRADVADAARLFAQSMAEQFAALLRVQGSQMNLLPRP